MALNLAQVEFDGNRFIGFTEYGEGFGDVLRRVNVSLALKKQRRFRSLWQQKGKWQEAGFIVGLDFKGQEACRSCGKFPRGDNEDVCAHCKQDRDTGQALQKTPVEGLYLAGMWTLPGHGIGPCIISGWQAAEMILSSG